MIVVTGAAGFIGSALVTDLIAAGYERKVIVVDDFYKDYKDSNLDDKLVREWLHRDLFLSWFERTGQEIEMIFHIGARTDTTEKDKSIFDELNVDYSKRIWQICVDKEIPLIYASSAATYGDGRHGYKDDHEIVRKLRPLNPYGDSKQEFDLWALEQDKKPPLWIGLKFFNVYGPNEYHKGRMASVIWHAYNQILETGGMKLFKSHRKDVENGHQARDFIYVKDVLKVCMYFFRNQNVPSGLYNLGTGEARTFLDLVGATFEAMNIKPNITFIDTPKDIRDTYQYFTEADISKLKSAGYTESFFGLEEGVRDYVENYIIPKKHY